MQIKIQILFVLIGLITSVHIDTLAKTSPNQQFLSSFFQKNELKGNSQEGAEGVKVLEKMIKDLERKDTDLHRKAKTDLDKCTSELKKLNCQDSDTWYDNIKNQNGNIKQWEKENEETDGKIQLLKDQKATLKKNHETAKEEARQKVMGNYRNIIKMIKKIIKVMVDTYNVTTTEDLSGIQSFVQTEQLIELQRDITVLSSVAVEDHFAQLANLYMNQAITALIEKRYDTKSAQKFVKLMEALIAKLRKGLEDNKNNFKYDDSQLKSDLSEVDQKIKKAEEEQGRNNIKIEVGKKANNQDYDKISKCQKASGQMSKCKEDFQKSTTLADSDDDLIRILKQVLKDTKALLGIVDEHWDNSLDSKVAEGDAAAWISEQVQKKLGNKKATLCFRASRDGFASPTFHSKCNGKGASITIIRTTKKQIIGGYNPNSWSSNNNYQRNTQGWLFSYNKRNVAVISGNPVHGTYNHNSYGPTFGGGHDLYVSNGCNKNKGSYANIGYTYKCPFGTHGNANCKKYYSAESNYHFGVEDYEVYILK